MSAVPRKVRVELDVPAKMRDGVTLRANVFRPDGPGRWPVLLMRTPYGKDELEAVGWTGFDPLQAVRRGFVVVVQDVRGRFASEGEWDPFRHEEEDGCDSVEWAAGLAGSNGRVGIYGGSYHGNTQWLAARAQPPSLAAISPAFTWSEPMEGLFARGGAVELGLALIWALDTGMDYLGRLGLEEAELRRRFEAVADERDRLGEVGYWELPVARGAALERHGLPDMGALRSIAETRVASWCRVSDGWDAVSAASLHTAGWYDIFLQGTLDNYEAMAARGQQARLVVGPWTHATFGDPIGGRVFGMRAEKNGFAAHPGGDVGDLQLAWFRQQLDPGSELEPPEAPVRIFVMGANEWRDEPSWPPARGVTQRWFLHSGGALDPAAPSADAPSSEFAYDPAHPVPTVGGHGVLSPAYPSGPFDQAEIEERADVLTFTSAPLVQELEVTGRVRVVLHAASSAPSTDWVARLCDVRPDGRSFNLCDGIVRVAGEPGAPARQEIDLWSTSNVFLRGHRLRVDVTSSSFPRWDRNLNTGEQGGTRIEVARQRICHDAERPSFVELPVVEG